MKLHSIKQLPKLTASNKKTVKISQILVVFVDSKLAIIGESLLTHQLQRVKSLIDSSNFTGAVDETSVDFDLAGTNLPLQLIGLGDVDKLTTASLQKIAQITYNALKNKVVNATLVLADALNKEQFHQFSLAFLNSSYRFDKYKSNAKAPLLSKVAILSTTNVKAEIDFATAVHLGQNLARDVAHEPANVCHPEYMAEQALALAKAHPDVLKVTVIDQNKMKKLGMNCFLSVSIGSDREGKLVLIEYYGKSKFSAKGKKQDDNSPIALVGKGVTFDTGGISLKPSAGMEEMKFDMGGSASVIGTMQALCESRLPVNVVAALACAENMPSARASRPGDVVTSMSGQTVEILNTDAEGRLVLCDTLTYIQRYNPTAIIDVATLTGACIVALGGVHSAVYSKDEDLLFSLQSASSQSGDTIWHMPLDAEYQSQIDSPVADMQNIGGAKAGSVTAACFLSRFVKEGQPWAHLDIAGTAWVTGSTKSATGRPVPMFMQYLKNAADS